MSTDIRGHEALHHRRCQPKVKLAFETFNTDVTAWVGKNPQWTNFLFLPGALQPARESLEGWDVDSFNGNDITRHSQ